MKRALSLIAGFMMGAAAVSPNNVNAQTYDIKSVKGNCPQGYQPVFSASFYLIGCKKQPHLIDAYYMGESGQSNKRYCDHANGWEHRPSSGISTTNENYSNVHTVWCVKFKQLDANTVMSDLFSAVEAYRGATAGNLASSSSQAQSNSASSSQSAEIASAPTTPFELMNGAKLLSVGEKVDPAPIAVGVPVKGCPTYSATKQILSTGSASDCEIVSKVYVAGPEQVNGYPSCKTMWMLDPYSKKCFRVDHS